MDKEKKQGSIYLFAIIILLSCFVADTNSFSYLIMFVLVPVFVGYVLCTNSARDFIFVFISAILFPVIMKLSHGFSVVPSIISTTLLLIPGVILGFSIKSKKDFKYTFVIHMIYDFSLLLIALGIIRFGYNINITEVIRDTISETFNLNIGIIRSLYPQAISVFENNEHQIFEAIYIGLPGYIPFFASIIFMFIFLLRYALCKVFFIRYLITNEVFSGGFDTFKNDVVTNCFALIMLFLSYVSETPVFAMLCLNAFFIVVLLYFIGGISVLEHKLKDKIHHPGKRLAAIIGIFVLLLIFGIFLPVVNFVYIFVFLGFADSLFDFRKLNAKKGDF